MSVRELKNNLIRLVEEVDDPVVLTRLLAYYLALQEGEDWWEFLSEEEKQRMEIGIRQLKEGRLLPQDAVKKEIQKIFERA